MIGIAVTQFHPRVGVDRTAEILVERLGSHAFNFAMRQTELLAKSRASVKHWCLVADAIKQRLLATIERRSD